MNIPIDNLLIVDIETVPINANYEDLSATMKKGWKLAPEEYAAKASFHPEYAKIVCVSFKTTGHIVSFCGDDESDILMKTRGVMNNAYKAGMQLAGFNIDRFDIPFVFKRSYISGVMPSAMVMYWDKKPWEIKTYDLMKMWSNGSWDQTVSLAVLAECIGVKSGKSDVDGSAVRSMYESGDFERIKSYCESDVMLVSECFSKIMSAATEPEPASYA